MRFSVPLRNNVDACEKNRLLLVFARKTVEASSLTGIKPSIAALEELTYLLLLGVVLSRVSAVWGLRQDWATIEIRWEGLLEVSLSAESSPSAPPDGWPATEPTRSSKLAPMLSEIKLMASKKPCKQLRLLADSRLVSHWSPFSFQPEVAASASTVIASETCRF